MSRSSTLAYYLRHDINYDFDPKGWRTVQNLCDKIGLSVEELINIVETDQKGRFEFDEKMTKVRALYGHSIDVYPDLKISTPPEILYHGTSIDRVKPILSEGLKPMRRKYVHLSTDIEAALKVGKRHGEPVVFILDTLLMVKSGYVFYLSKTRNSEIWMTSIVLPEYLKLI